MRYWLVLSLLLAAVLAPPATGTGGLASGPDREDEAQEGRLMRMKYRTISCSWLPFYMRRCKECCGRYGRVRTLHYDLVGCRCRKPAPGEQPTEPSDEFKARLGRRVAKNQERYEKLGKRMKEKQIKVGDRLVFS